MRKTTIVGLKLVAMLLAACGGEDAAIAPVVPVDPGNIQYTPGVFQPAATFAAQCQVPRTGNDPDTGRPYPDVRGSTTLENHWLRSWNNRLYLWYREVPDVNPATVTTTEAYFEGLKTPALLPSGQPKDRFHFLYDTEAYRQLTSTGVQVGYGIFWFVQNRTVLVQFVEPGSPAATAGITRGAQMLVADGVDIMTANTQTAFDTVNNAMAPIAAGETHQFVFRDRGGVNRTVPLTAAAVARDPAPVVRTLSTATGNVGYLLFNDHIATAETRLIAAINTLAAQNVQDLVLDLRYNGGGFLTIASQLGYMIAGPALTNGRTFERLQFNDKHTVTNPVTGEGLAPTPFYNTTRGLSVAPGQALPTLNLQRVYVLTSRDTCSASESIINGLRGIGLPVYQFGGDTCGKPHGFYPQDNCGTTYFSIQFAGVNQLGFGDYVDGFSVTRTDIEPQARLPGCPASDDFSRDLGDASEERLRVALAYRATGVCTGTLMAQESQEPLPEGLSIQRPDAGPWRTNRILR